jgi:hypothetical protein
MKMFLIFIDGARILRSSASGGLPQNDSKERWIPAPDRSGKISREWLLIVFQVIFRAIGHFNLQLTPPRMKMDFDFWLVVRFLNSIFVTT